MKGENMEKTNILIDYLTVSIPMTDYEEKFMEYEEPSINNLAKNEYLMDLLAIMGVKFQNVTNNHKIANYAIWATFHEHIQVKAYGPKNKHDKKTHLIELKGAGCREIETLGGNWDTIFKYLAKNRLKVTRLDLALDVLTHDYFTITDLEKKADNGEFVSPLRNYRKINNYKNANYNGLSLYFGTRKGTQINIYDKKMERRHNGYEVNTNTWIRIELRLKSERAYQVIQLIGVMKIEELRKTFFKLLRGYLDFKEEPGKRIERVRTWKPWAQLLENAEKTKLVNQAELENTLAQKKEHLKRSYGKTILKIALGGEDIKDFIKEMAQAHYDKMTMKDLEQINKYRKSRNMKAFETIEEAIKSYEKKGVN